MNIEEISWALIPGGSLKNAGRLIGPLRYLRLQFSNFKQFVSSSCFRGALNNTNIIEFGKFLLQFKNQKSGSKTVCSFFSFLLGK